MKASVKVLKSQLSFRKVEDLPKFGPPPLSAMYRSAFSFAFACVKVALPNKICVMHQGRLMDAGYRMGFFLTSNSFTLSHANPCNAGKKGSPPV